MSKCNVLLDVGHSGCPVVDPRNRKEWLFVQDGNTKPIHDLTVTLHTDSGRKRNRCGWVRGCPSITKSCKGIGLSCEDCPADSDQLMGDHKFDDAHMVQEELISYEDAKKFWKSASVPDEVVAGYEAMG